MEMHCAFQSRRKARVEFGESEELISGCLRPWGRVSISTELSRLLSEELSTNLTFKICTGLTV
jgi:hypothetical protein